MIPNQTGDVEGGCHCGRVRFRIQLDASVRALRCNCSICERKGFLHLILEPEAFTLLCGADMLQTYTFGTHTAVHRFCTACGVHPFYTPRSHPDKVDVNAYCLDDHLADHLQVDDFDGRNWEASFKKLENP